MKNLSRILYISRASAGVGVDEFKKILDVSRKNNKERKITGILCGGGGHFIQVLEGPQEELFRLYGKILEDRRHYDSVLIGVAPIKQRMFSDWAMGYIAKPPDVMEVRRKELLEIWLGHTEASEFLSIMKRFLTQLMS